MSKKSTEITVRLTREELEMICQDIVGSMQSEIGSGSDDVESLLRQWKDQRDSFVETSLRDNPDDGCHGREFYEGTVRAFDEYAALAKKILRQMFDPSHN